jgi:hypothetical protein
MKIVINNLPAVIKMIKLNYYFYRIKGTLAQLVQSACLTGKRSLVRFQYAPPSPSEANPEHVEG